MALVEQRLILIWTVVASMPIYAFTVVGLAIWRPEALQGRRPTHFIDPQHFANDLYMALEGAMANRDAMAREEAWTTIGDILTAEDYGLKEHRDFCNAVVKRLQTLASLRNRTRLSESIGRLADLVKGKQALAMLQVDTKDLQTLEKAKEALQAQVRSARASAEIAKVARAFREVGILVE